jgi:plastocyanin
MMDSSETPRSASNRCDEGDSTAQNVSTTQRSFEIITAHVADPQDIESATRGRHSDDDADASAGLLDDARDGVSVDGQGQLQLQRRQSLVTCDVFIRLGVFLWLLVLSMELLRFRLDEESRMTQSSPKIIDSSSSKLASMFHVASLPDGNKALRVDVEKIVFSASRDYAVSEKIANSKRIWSPEGITVYVGDTVTWTWTTNENIVSCNKEGDIFPPGSPYRTLNSGAITGSSAAPGTYSFRFTESGQYRYTSENSQTLSGVVVVLDIPEISLDRDKLGPISPIPSGVQKKFPVDDVGSLDGCWELCYDAPHDLKTPSNFLDSCEGDWVFMALVNTVSSPDYFTIGAFGAKSDIFANPISSHSAVKDPTIEGHESNDVYWFKYDDPSYDYHSVGFSSSQTIQLSRDSGFGISPSNVQSCTDGLSWSVGNRNDLSAQCSSRNENKYHKVVLTNTCELLIPPKEGR